LKLKDQDTWRFNHNNQLKIAPQTRLAQFQNQIAAADSRGPLGFGTERNKRDIRRIAKNRAWTAKHLVADVELAQQGSARNAAGQLFLYPGAGRNEAEQLLLPQGVASEQYQPKRFLTEEGEPVIFNAPSVLQCRRTGKMMNKSGNWEDDE
jgi:hypothetical protein